ncbi:PIG-L family deacetylase [Fictibacillus gelatini]|uniref:PIG-L family deacetylase n=1 Tax=Fictibacillus gelatini TaxID=225985 RepID=UPI00040E5E98|nr:PIG-L family deacetylase [Fictibacillus gelatini]
MRKKWFSCLASFLLLVSLMVPIQANGKEKDQKPVELWGALKPLDTIVSFMNTGAHPDDERSDMLAYLSRGRGVRTASLLANRGEGGQNEIGNELGNALGIIRSRELMEAAKITGVQVFHLSQKPDDEIYDFGFSKSVEETLTKWGEDVAYERLIRIIRTYRPDIIMPSFLNVNTEHGHHRTVNVLTLRAFKDAADPKVFPEQLKEGLSPWQIKKLYLPASDSSATTSFEIGMYDDIYGMTYPQLGEESRFLHKSQGMGKKIPAEPRTIHLNLAKSVMGIPVKESSMFDSIPYNFKEYAANVSNEPKISTELKKLQNELEQLISLYPNDDKIADLTYDVLQHERQVAKMVKASNMDKTTKEDLLFRLSIKEQQLTKLSEVASKVKVETDVENPTLVRNGSTKVKVTISNNGKKALQHVNVNLSAPEQWKVTRKDQAKTVKPGERAVIHFTVHVPKNASYYQPYDPPVIHSKVTYDVKRTKTTHQFEPKQTVAVLPEVSLQSDPESLVVNTADVKEKMEVSVKAKNYQKGPLHSVLSLKVPRNWKVTPSAVPVSFTKQNEEKTVTFTVKPPKDVKEGNFTFDPFAVVHQRMVNTAVQVIHYDHIGTFYYLYDAKTKGVSFPLAFNKNLKIGYVESGFDNVADELRRVGMNIASLTEGQLETTDLSQFDTIVLGIRAYLSREDLLANNQKLLDYVKNGGHLVVQYNKPEDHWDADSTAPYKLVIGSPSIQWRVTDEQANVTVLKPEHALFNTPNKITDKDWDNWIQERGLYYPSEWSDQFEPLVRMADPNEKPFDGGILLAHYGKGTYIYSSLVWYRQIQNQVPGGYRIFTNLMDYNGE